MTQRRVVYTALLGGYEDLINQEVAPGSGVDFICFTDDLGLTSDTWELRVVEPSFPLDMVRSQRDLKIRGHSALSAYDEVMYIDNSVLLKMDPNQIFDSWLGRGDYAVSFHSTREKVIDEFDEVRALHYDNPSRIDEQLLHYAELYPDVLDERPYWNGMSVRRNTPEVARMMEIWFDHVLRYSRRDQLSANVAFSLGGVDITGIEEDNNFSDTHQWPAGVNRKSHLTVAARRRSGPLLAEVRRTQIELDAAYVSISVQELELRRQFAAQLELKENELDEAFRALAQTRSRSAAFQRLFGPRFYRLLRRVFRR